MNRFVISLGLLVLLSVVCFATPDEDDDDFEPDVDDAQLDGPPLLQRGYKAKRTKRPKKTTPPPPPVAVTRPRPVAPPVTRPAAPPVARPPVALPIAPADRCFQCRMRRNQKDLYADETDCHFYYQCFYYNETFAVGMRRQCAVGTFWHDQVLQCMPEGPTPCVDRCMDDATSAKGCYAGAGCRQFFVCSNTASYGMCCPEGSRFNEALCTCDEDMTCTDQCALQGPLVPTAVAPATQFNATVCRDSFGVLITPAPGEANAYYLIDQDGLLSEKMYCAETTAFDLTTCRCDIETGVMLPSTPQKCQATLWLPFDTDLRDYSIHKFSTFPYGGADRDATTFAQGGGSLLVNNGYLEIPGLKTLDLRNNASFCAFFQCNGGSCGSGGVLSNNKDGTSTEFTVIMGTQATNTFTGRLQFWHPVGTQTLTRPLTTPANGWNHVCITYDGNTIRLYLNGVETDTLNVGGYLAVAHCPYAIGHDQGLGFFTGHIDDVFIAPCALPPADVNALRTGDRATLHAKGYF